MSISSHRQRLLTALGIAILPILGIVYMNWVLFGLLALFSILTLNEFYAMFLNDSGRKTLAVLGTLFTVLILLAFKSGDIMFIGATLIGAFWLAAMLFLFRFSNQPDTTGFKPFLLFLAGLIYIPVNFHFALNFTRAEILLILLAAVASDTFAYYAGSIFGGPKIWPTVSPKKTWAGSIGGMTGCTITTLLVSYWATDQFMIGMILLGILLNIACQLGDFFESALKRSRSIKDSGSLLPGHGGLLDRVDSMLFALPVYGLLQTIFPFMNL